MHRIRTYRLFAGNKNPYSLDRYSVDALSLSDTRGMSISLCLYTHAQVLKAD